MPAERYAAVAARLRASLSAGDVAARAAVRLRLFATLFNAIDEGVAKAEKLATFSSLVALASESKQLELLSPYFATAAGWQAKWGISDAETRALYLAVSRALDKAGDSEAAQAFLIRYLTTFEGAGAADIGDEAKARARDAAVGFVKAPAVSQRSALPQLAAVSRAAAAAVGGVWGPACLRARGSDRPTPRPMTTPIVSALPVGGPVPA